ncbi:unnamed protein product [Symbiodinium sp. CCMP2456]|nr:unnamed protein product [Symbiodinium sp. CCMP2456]
MECSEEAEEEAAEFDPPVEPTAPVVLQRKPPLHSNSSTSIASDATTLILGGTPLKTPSPRPVVPAEATPSPPSLPKQVVFKEVLYVAESPRKLVKAEPRDFNEEPRLGDDLRRELADLQAAQQALLKAGAMLAPEPAPTEPEPTEPETQVEGATALDKEANRLARLNSTGALVESAVTREEQLEARKRRKQEKEEAKAAAKAAKAAKAATADKAAIAGEDKDGQGAEAAGKSCEGDGQLIAEKPVEPHPKKRRTAAKSKPGTKQQQAAEEAPDLPAAVAPEAEEAPDLPAKAAPEAEHRAEAAPPKLKKGKDKVGKVPGKKAANKPKSGPGKANGKKDKSKGQGNGKKSKEAIPVAVPRRVSSKRGPNEAAKPKSELQLEEEKAELRKIVVSTNGTLKHYVIMVYWTRPGVGIKLLADGKQVQYLGGKGIGISKILNAAIDCVACSRLGCCFSRLSVLPGEVCVPVHKTCFLY